VAHALMRTAFTLMWTRDRRGIADDAPIRRSGRPIRVGGSGIRNSSVVPVLPGFSRGSGVRRRQQYMQWYGGWLPQPHGANPGNHRIRYL